MRWTDFPHGEVELIDLSVGIESGVASEPFPPSVEYGDHEQGAGDLAANLRSQGHDVHAADFPDGIGLAWESLELITHAGTHVDAPWHYGPTVGDAPAKTIDEVPLSWCAGDAVVLDFTELAPRTEITPADIDDRLAALDHTLQPGEIVLLETGADALWGTPAYLTDFPGLGAAGTRHLVDQGVRVIGTDAYGLDKPFAEMGRRFLETGDPAELWPAHFTGRDVEYCQIEKMANLGALPRRTHVPIVTFPVKVVNASGGWARPVAFVDAAA